MPNQPRPDNPNRVIRFENRLWKKVCEAAAAERVSASELVRRAVEKYLGEK